MRAVKGNLGHSLQERRKESEGLRWTRVVESIPVARTIQSKTDTDALHLRHTI